MNRAGVLAAIAAAGLPPAVAAYLAAFAAGRAPSQLRRDLKRAPAEVAGGLAALLRQAAAVLARPPESVLFETGFCPNNLAPERLEAAMAELRAAVFLAAEGFQEIRLLPPCKSRSADLAARRGAAAYAFEVRRVGEGAALPALAGKCRDKLRQAAVSRKRGGLTHCGVILVTGAGGFGPLARAPRQEAAAAGVYAAAGSPARAHVCLLAGGLCGVWPAW
ncbi:MAG: hypothetical protein NDI60_01800 [Elusimicrobiales bacterium]|nr:hypothetical protein [Elusimicrobiales bacterium]